VGCESGTLTTWLSDSIGYIWIYVRVHVEELWRTGKHVGGAAICVLGVRQSDRMCIGQQPINEKGYMLMWSFETRSRLFYNPVTEE
jgi:hypothetical protein